MPLARLVLLVPLQCGGRAAPGREGRAQGPPGAPPTTLPPRVAQQTPCTCTFCCGAPANHACRAQEWSGALQRIASSDYTGAVLLQLKKQALVLDLIHYLDVLDQLAKERCANASPRTSHNPLLGSRRPACWCAQAQSGCEVVGACRRCRRCASAGEWAWTRQLRYYANPKVRPALESTLTMSCATHPGECLGASRLRT